MFEQADFYNVHNICDGVKGMYFVDLVSVLLNFPHVWCTDAWIVFLAGIFLYIYQDIAKNNEGMQK